jgi:hypothetical protein
MPTTRDGVFNFQHPLLRESGVRFLRDHDRSLCLSIELGHQRAIVTASALAGFMSVDADHPDLSQLGLIDDALRFSRSVKHGDSIPSELVTGRPSWKPTEQQRRKGSQALARTLGGLRPPTATGATATDIARCLVDRFSTKSYDVILAVISEVIEIVSFTSALQYSVYTFQKMLGDLMRLVKKKSGIGAQRILASAQNIRPLAGWASKVIINLDLISSDIQSAIENSDLYYNRSFNLINTLRCWVLDVEPVLHEFLCASKRGDGASDRHIDQVCRLIARRHETFDPTFYNTPTLAS